MEALAQVLRDLPRPEHPDLLVGADHFEDAGVFRLNESLAIVQTLDFFPPLVDDPYTFGQIAAANSLSDIYAMGAKPLTALNIVAFPDKELPAEILGQILKGGSERVTAAGAVIVGGHSVRDAEIKYGLSVTGSVHPDQIVGNDGAQNGDVLVLTKPIGSGVLTSAAKLDKMPTDDLAEAVDVMVDLNAGAAAAMLTVGINAATDITGFGLIGHAFEMAAASNVTFTLEASTVPLMTDTLRLATDGILTRAHKSNLEYIGDKLHVESVDPVLVNILADAQTSGGLLISVPSDRCDKLIELLKQNKTRAYVVIGRVSPRADSVLSLC